MHGVIADLVTLASVAFIDLTLACDNAIVVGMVACRVPPAERRRVVFIGISLALLLRLGFALIAVELLDIIGLLLAGGLLLLWVGWKLARELPGHAAPGPASACAPAPAKSASVAIVQIAAADVSMSLDNVLAVAGAARHNMVMLAFGLALSVAFMGFAATLVAGILARHPWLNYLGLAIIAVVALTMIYDGGRDVLAALGGV